jgi:hypothetical protein
MPGSFYTKNRDDWNKMLKRKIVRICTLYNSSSSSSSSSSTDVVGSHLALLGSSVKKDQLAKAFVKA